MNVGDYVYGATAPRSWLHRLTEPLFVLSNVVFSAALYPVTLTTRVRWSPSPAGLAEYLKSRWRPLIYYSWHGNSWPSFIAFRSLPRALRPTAVAHDGAVSRVNARSGAWTGIDMLIFQRHAVASPREQIVAYVEKNRRHLMLFPDSGGPYRRLKPGMLEIASELDAALVPFMVRARPEITLGRTMRHLLPLPFGDLELRYATPFAAAEATIERCERSLAVLAAAPGQAAQDS